MTSAIVTARSTSKGHLGSQLAAAVVSAGQFNHEMLLDDSLVFEAVPWYGTRLVIPAVALRGVVRYQDVYVPVPDVESMRAFGREQLGKHYDWPGAVGLPFRHADAWQNPDWWWCRELVFAMLDAGGAWHKDPAGRTRARLKGIRQTAWPKSPIILV